MSNENAKAPDAPEPQDGTASPHPPAEKVEVEEEAPSSAQEETPADEKKPPEPTKPPVLPLSLPRTMEGTWRRDLRLGGEVVGKGKLVFTTSGVYITGRRTGPIRTSLWTGFWATWWFGVLASMAVAVTGLWGVAQRTQSLEAALSGASCVLPTILIGALMMRWVAHRILEPKVKWMVPWDDVERLAANKTCVQLRVGVDGSTWLARMTPKKKRWHTQTLRGIRKGQIPHGEHASGWVRPAFLDKLAFLVVFGVLGGLAWKAEPIAAELVARAEEPRSGPLAGIPDPVSLTQVEDFMGSCRNPSPVSASLGNRQEGDALVWTAGGAQGHQVHTLRWQAATRRVELVAKGERGAGRTIPGFFRTKDEIGVSLLIPDSHARDVATMLGNGRLEELRSAWCSGFVSKLDITQSKDQVGSITATRDGDDLLVEVTGVPAEAYAVLPVRWHSGPGPEAFHACSVPQQDGTLGLLRVKDKRRIRGFFTGAEESARVYLIDRKRAGSLHPLTDSAALIPCAIPDSLWHSGISTAWTKVSTAQAHGPVSQKAASLAASPPMVPVATDAQSALDAVRTRYGEVLETLGQKGLTRSDYAALDRGFLGGVQWGPLLDSVSFGRSLPRLEVQRQRLSALDPNNKMGELFLLAFAQAFLERLPAEEKSFQARVALGETWLAVQAGTTWQLDGRAVTVPDAQNAAVYQLIGRYVLVDVARALEVKLNKSGTGEVPKEWLPLADRLESYSVRLDLEKSSSNKAFDAWTSGNFEYLADRAVKKAQAGLSDQQQALSAAWSASYRLQTEHNVGADVRYSRLVRDGRQLGWVAQFAPRSTRMSYVLASELGTSEQALRAKSGGTLLLATSGSYVTPSGQTSGLAVFDGRVENFLISHKMDGLVIVHPQHGLSLMDMRKGGSLPGQSEVIRPLRSITDLQNLVSWLEEEGASAFQTHLLVSETGITIDEETASPDQRERRLLVQCNYKGSPIVALVDIPGQNAVSLFEAAVIAKQALETPESQGGPGLTVTGVANLDVGSYDVLRVWNQGGGRVRDSPKSLSDAHNLILFAN